MKLRKITKITYHYFCTEHSVETSVVKDTEPCLNIFYNNWWGRKMVLMINPTWNSIRFITEKQYCKNNYKKGRVLKNNNLGGIAVEVIKGWKF